MKKIKSILSRYKNLASIYIKMFNFFSLKKRDETKIVICFNGFTPHGGLLDRLKGIISFYEVAKQKNIPFFIHFITPFNLEEFLQPNTINWEIDKIEFNPFTDKIIYLMNNFEVNPLNLINSKGKRTYYVYCNIDYLEKIYQLKSSEFIFSKWRNNYNELFKPSDFLNESINKLPTEKRVVCHTRFTTLMGDFKDSTSLILDDNSQIKLIDKIKNELEKIVIKHPDLNIYILSDSIKFLDLIQKENKFKILPGVPKHIDNKDNVNNIQEHIKTFTDFYFISSSEVVYLINIAPMHNSAFSKYAAILGNKTFLRIQ